MSHGAYKEAHPFPARVTHWIHLVCMVVLAFTGFFIHFPFSTASMELMRSLHFVCMWLVLINLVIRFVLVFTLRDANVKGTREVAPDWINWIPQPENKGKFLRTIGYYLFVVKKHPRTGKYNPLQKLAYVAMQVFLVLQGITGFAIYGPTDQVFAGLTDAVGGLMVMRMAHYFIMWVFILITMIHVYLSCAEDVEALPLMFLGKETPAPEH
ncbi:MAG: Ni/Fe-hydrogenase, b-type cytochrome subunit [Actinobacteria bacterium]|nr:MAG: Ni/Fe-hydrogenase, b-type cytochrome subunit [Actinomycetota bacterium]